MSKDRSNQKPGITNRSQNGILGLIGFGAMVYVMGLIFPDTWWGTNFSGFLPEPWPYIILGVGLICFSLPFWNSRQELAHRIDQNWEKGRRAPIWLTAGLIAFLLSIPFLFFDLAFDPYGDAPTYSNLFDSELNKVDHWKLFLSLDIFQFKSGERTVLNLAAILVNQFGLTPEGAFLWIGRVSGFLYIYLVVLMAMKVLKRRLSVLLVGAALISPALVIFMGHFEIYAPLFPALAAFLSLVILFLRNPGWGRLLLSGIFLFVCLKLHLSSILLIPVWLLLILFFLMSKRENFVKRMNWKNLSLWVILPLFALAMVLYFVVLGDYNDSRDPNTDPSSYDRIFLPILSPNAPLDRYNLLGGNHLLDFGNLLLVWSPLAILILLVAVLPLRKKIQWNALPVMALGLCFILYFGFFFLLNPLLGMPIDWDLMAIPSPVLICFVLVILANSESEPGWKWLPGPAIGFAILVLPVAVVHSQEDLLNERYIGNGRHSFRTYWVGSAGFIMKGFQKKLDEPTVFQVEFKETLESIRPFAEMGMDIEYGVLAKNFGAYYRLEVHDQREAEKYHLLADKYHPTLGSNLDGLAQIYIDWKDYQSALPYCNRLVILGYPDRKSSLRRGLEVALRAKDWGKATEWTKSLLKLYPNDPDLTRTLTRLESKTDLDQVLELFDGPGGNG